VKIKGEYKMASENLEERVKKLEHELERLRAVNEIHNIVGKIQAYHTAGVADKLGGILVAQRPDTRLYTGDSGFFEGPDAFERVEAVQPKGGPLGLHGMVNPIIEVAEDGQTAQAIFIGIGIAAMKDKTGTPRCMWEWTRYGSDFVKENGQWKLWHHHVYPLFRVDWDEKWADQFDVNGKGLEHLGRHGIMEDGEPMDLNPDFPPTPLDVSYNPDVTVPLIPIPKPYKTWKDTTMY